MFGNVIIEPPVQTKYANNFFKKGIEGKIEKNDGEDAIESS
jgi:hypothetical protein